MNNEERINKIFRLIANNRLGAALIVFKSLLDDRIFVQLTERYEKIKGDYDLLLSYMQRSYDDPTRGQLFSSLLSKLYKLNADALHVWKNRNVQSYINATKEACRIIGLTNAEIRLTLENYVADVALLGLMPDEEQREQKENGLHKTNTDFTASLFHSILVSNSWNKDEALFYQNLILAPTVDTADAALIVTAITVSCMNIFDSLKWKVLTEVYQMAQEEKVRQRALVGWAVSLPDKVVPDKMVEQTLAVMLLEPNICDDLHHLQRQIFLCMNAEKDTRQIQEDILPGLIKNNHLNITRFGLTEQEEDPLKDILDPGAEDRAMEEVEESIQRMMDMQKAGADIYFGGFSMMKRFGFFYHTDNWFRIFDSRHPELAHVRRKIKDVDLFDKLIEKGPFCDSDKYSFALGLASVLDRLPDEYRSMLGQADMFGPVEQTQVMQSPAYVRRMYLQDLYRFFKLAEVRNDFKNPFQNDNALFFANAIIARLLPTDRMAQLGTFLLKQQHFMQLGQLLKIMDNDEQKKEFGLLRGSWLMHEKRYADAAKCFEMATKDAPDDRAILHSLAKAYYQAGIFEKAGQVYQKLMTMKPGHVPFVLYAAMCRLKTDMVPQAVDMLYQCHFEHPDNTKVVRVLAWALMADGKPDKAQRYYNELLGKEVKTMADDYLNAAYCKWALHQVAEAAELFGGYLNASSVADTEKRNEVLFNAIMSDKDILLINGIQLFEIPIMVDLATTIS